MTPTDPIPRFWAKVDKENGPVHPTLGRCWQWTARLNDNGYGRFYPTPKTETRAHRYAYELLTAPIPDGLDIDHLCRNRGCVNPAHLEPVTRRENLLRGETLPAANMLINHCPKGHEYTPENIIWQGPRKAQRRCRQCNRDSCRARLERRCVP